LKINLSAHQHHYLKHTSHLSNNSQKQQQKQQQQLITHKNNNNNNNKKKKSLTHTYSSVPANKISTLAVYEKSCCIQTMNKAQYIA